MIISPQQPFAQKLSNVTVMLALFENNKNHSADLQIVIQQKL